MNSWITNHSKYYYCVRGTRTQPLIFVGCSVHYWVSCEINKGVFLRLHLCRNTFASLWGACLRFASLWRTNSSGDSCFLGVHLLFIFCLLWKMRGTPSACIKPVCLARRPLCHEVNLPGSWEARRPLCHKVNLLSCVARRPLLHKVNLPKCEAWRRHFIITCDIFGPGQINILALSYFFG